MDMNSMIIAVSFLICVAILIYNPAKTRGVPAALVFIFTGLFVGNGLNGPAYDYPEQTELLSQFALSLIIFGGGFQTPYSRIKPVLKEGMMLANIGVLISALLLGLFASLVTPLTLVEGLLLGATVSSTDAATTFSILEAKKLKLKDNVDKALEFESATNDPMALILTLMFSMMLQKSGDSGLGAYILYFFQQLIIGGLIAFIIARIVTAIYKRTTFQEESLKPIFLFFLLLFTSLTAGKLGGNVLVASYVLGVILGNSQIQYKDRNVSFFQSFTWLAQSLMFLLLGLQIFPKHVADVFFIALIPTLFLFIIARPVAVFLSYIPFRRVSFRKKLFVSWVGIKGATPIVFALVPLTMGIPNAEMIFNIVVVIVLASMLIHGFTLEPAARFLKMMDT